ncbi:MAG TPA: rhomboid family intramembrane serine protease [Candidatus Didemnitutus sp.]|nr:rhomboid family intramembrane serine protease [Candidatus Didemnitutus sp.]
MTANAASSPSKFAFEIRYDRPLNSLQNRDFKGEGRLVVRPDGPTYAFTGEPRYPGAGVPAERVFAAREISDVACHGAVVQFTRTDPLQSRSGAPFVFHCQNDAEAQEIVRLLPKHLGLELLEQEKFTAQLRAVYGTSPAWKSVTAVIIALNLAMYCLMGLLGAGWFSTESMRPYVNFAANNGAATTDGEWWRLLTSMFTHFGLLHLALNMWALWKSGLEAERLFGRRLFALIYLASGLTGGLTSIFWHGDKVWSAGASGAIFGVIGSLFGFTRRQHRTIPRSVLQPMMQSTIAFAGYNLLYGLARPTIDNSAHIGGLIGGVLFGWLLALPVDASARTRLVVPRLCLGSAVLAGIVAIGVIFAPHFNYRVRDELAYDQVNETFQTRETEFLKHNVDVLNHLDGPAKEAAHATWLNREMIPYYADWRGRLASLSLAPDKQTGRSRDALVDILDARLLSLHHLADGLGAHDPQAVQRYAAEQQAVSAKIEAFEKRK